MNYLLSVASPPTVWTHQILVFGANNYIERELEGLRPDVALMSP